MVAGNTGAGDMATSDDDAELRHMEEEMERMRLERELLQNVNFVAGKGGRVEEGS